MTERKLGYHANGNTFIPEATGQIIDPLEMDQTEADMIFGPEFMAAVRSAQERMKKIVVNKYVQLVPANPEKG